MTAFDVNAEVNLTHRGEADGFWPSMLTQEQAVETRVMTLRGEVMRGVGRQLGFPRNTMRRYVRDGHARRYRPRAPRPCKLDSYRA